MRLSEGVEWAIHCTVLLAVLPDGASLSATRLAEYHAVPAPYLAKCLQALARGGVVESSPGRGGGYRLARSAASISLLDVVEAVDGDEPAFRCTEIRRRGPSAVAARYYTGPCSIAVAMARADRAWRRELAATTLADITQQIVVSAPAQALRKGAAWLQCQVAASAAAKTRSP